MDYYAMGYTDGYCGLEPWYPNDDEYMAGYFDGDNDFYYDGWY
jgi:hypothetical protein